MSAGSFTITGSVAGGVRVTLRTGGLRTTEEPEPATIPEGMRGGGPVFLGVRNLRYSMLSAALECGVSGHPQMVMRSLGISYVVATPQSIADQWWFWGCVGGPSELPPYLSVLGLDPRECVGFGLSESDVSKILEKGEQ